jgi:hypothetical protein
VSRKIFAQNLVHIIRDSQLFGSIAIGAIVVRGIAIGAVCRFPWNSMTKPVLQRRVDVEKGRRIAQGV